MDIKSFVECAKALPNNISIMIKGGHGIGKSEVVAQIAEQLGLPLVDRRISQLTEGDLLGLPKLDDADQTTKWYGADFIVDACRRPVLLFLDEINRGTQEVMQSCFQLALDRCLSGNRLHPDTRVFTAVNTGGNYQVTEMDPAFLDRFWVADLSPTPEDFFEHAETRDVAKGGPVHDDLLRFLKEHPSRLDPSDANPGTVQPSRRSWVRLDRTYRANGIYDADFKEDARAKGRAYSLAVGLVGLEAANDLVDFLSTRESRYTAGHVMDEYPKHRSKIRELGQDKFNALIDLIVEDAKARLWTPEQGQNLGSFAEDLPAELRVALLTQMTKGLRGHDNFKPNFKTAIPHVTPHVVKSFDSEGKLITSKDADEKEPSKGKKGKK